MKINKVLVYRIGALGDVLMTTPFLRELKNQNNNISIDYLTGKSNYILLKDNVFLNKIITIGDDLYFKYKIIDFIKLILRIRKEKYDEIYIMDKHWIFAFTGYLFGIKKRIGFFRDKISKIFLTNGINYGKEVKHEVDYNLELLGKIRDGVNKSLYFNLQKKDKEVIIKYLEEKNIKDYIVVINDGGNNGFEVGGIRMLPDNKLKELLEKISKDNIVFLLAGPNMKDYYNKFVFNRNIINIAGKFKIPESIALMKFADKIYSTDCGPMHMAATVNENIIGFFGPTHPKRKIPFIKNGKYFWTKKDEKKYNFDYEDFGKKNIGEVFFEDFNYFLIKSNE